MRSLAVDLSLLAGLEFDINAGEAVWDPDQIDAAAEILHQLRDIVAGEARHESQSHAFVPKVTEDNGNVDPLAPGKNVLISGPVDNAGFKIVDPDNVVKRRVECDCVDHLCKSLLN